VRAVALCAWAVVAGVALCSCGAAAHKAPTGSAKVTAEAGSPSAAAPAATTVAKAGPVMVTPALSSTTVPAAAVPVAPPSTVSAVASPTSTSATASSTSTTASSTTTSSATASPSTTAEPASPVAHGPVTSPPLPAPGPGFIEGQVTAIGDSVMLDYGQLLAQAIPGTEVDAAVSRQWYGGEAIVEQLKAQRRLGSVVIIGLGTNGPVTTADFNQMMSELQGASRVVFVNVHVDRPWQGPVNAVLAAGVARYPRTVLANWCSLANAHPAWLYSDGTHLPVDGPGAQALAALVAAKA